MSLTRSDKDYLDAKLDPLKTGIDDLKNDNSRQWEHITKLTNTSNKSCVNIARLDEQVKILYKSKKTKRPKVENNNGSLIVRIDPNLVGKIILLILLIIASGLGLTAVVGGS